MTTSKADVDRILKLYPQLARGPGGIAAVLRDGELIGKRAWGYANLERRIPMTATTHFPVCSISKQMVCLVLVSLVKDPTPQMLDSKDDPAKQFEAEMHRLLPGLPQGELKVADLYNMQSGIRDVSDDTILWR
jgi:CubicO group peptidase (beta-lactamase class C family)